MYPFVYTHAVRWNYIHSEVHSPKFTFLQRKTVGGTTVQVKPPTQFCKYIL